MPRDLVLKGVNVLHRSILAVSRGRWGNIMAGMPSLQLTTLGRKSGRQRAVMLTAPVVDGETIVVVASRAGAATHPAWYLNLRANPVVSVSFQSGPERSMTARTATATERAQLWPRVTAVHKPYARYQRRTSREIPLVLLTPA